jgi:hypothetical protein
MEIKQAMNTITTATPQAQRNEGKLAISEATAVFAWCETRDEAAGHWLTSKYRSLVSQVVALEIRDATLRSYLTEEALRAGLNEIDAETALTCGDAFFAMVTQQVCQQAEMDMETCELLAA